MVANPVLLAALHVHSHQDIRALPVLILTISVRPVALPAHCPVPTVMVQPHVLAVRTLIFLYLPLKHVLPVLLFALLAQLTRPARVA
jgi:hypothetical protein